MQIYPKYIYKDLRFHPYSTIHATARSTKTRSGRWHCQAAVTVSGPGGSLTSSWPGGRGVCKPVTVTVEW